MEKNEELAPVTAPVARKTTLKTIRDPLVGTTIDERYQIVSLVGHGATSSVYRATDSTNGDIVAIKVLHSHLASDEALVERFKREAKTASILTHPNIVAVHEYAVSEAGIPYLVMEFVEGTSLQQVLTKEGWLPVNEAIKIFEQIGAALCAAHEKGVIHRDLKPGNIMITRAADGSSIVKVLDFGIAQIMPMLGDTVLKLTQTGEMLGSLLYMSPEQCLDQDVDERSDCYSLGCLMYETVTGKPPLAARTAFETMNKHMTTMPSPLAQVRPDLTFPKGMQSIIFKALAKAPEKRYQSIAALLKDLKLLAIDSNAEIKVGYEEPANAPIAVSVRSITPISADMSSADMSSGDDPSKLVDIPLGLARGEFNPWWIGYLGLLWFPCLCLLFCVPLLAAFSIFLSVILIIIAAPRFKSWERLATTIVVEQVRCAPEKRSYIPTVEEVRSAKIKVRASVVRAMRAGPLIDIELGQPILFSAEEPNSQADSKPSLPDGLSPFMNTNRLLIDPAEKSNPYWKALCNGGIPGLDISFPVSAMVIVGNDDRILSVVVGTQAAWVHDTRLPKSN